MIGKIKDYFLFHKKKIFFREIENRQGARDIGGVCNENANFVVMTMKMMLHIQ